MTKQKKFLQYLGIILVFGGVFILPHNVRKEIVNIWNERTYLWNINYISWLGFALLFILNLKKMFEKKWEWAFLIFPLLALPLLFYNVLETKGLGYIVVYSSCCVFSLYFMFLKLDEEVRLNLIRLFLIMLDICVIIAVICAVIDTAFDKAIIKQIAPIMKHSPAYMSVATADPSNLDHNRFYSLWGQPLLNAIIFNIFFILNISYTEAGNKTILPKWLVCVIALVGVACCGSKTGIVVVVLITVIAFYREKKLLILAAAGLAVIALSGISDILIARFLTQPLTTGRANALKGFLQDDTLCIRFIQGYGSTNPAIEKGYWAALEFPVLNYAFQFGLLFSLIVLGTSVIYVTYRLCRKGTIRYWLLWGLIFAEMNTFSSFAEDRDNAMIFYIFTMVLLNICMSFRTKTE